MNEVTVDTVILDKDGMPVNEGDVLYDDRGNEVTVIHLKEFRRPRNFFERFVSIGKAGEKVVLRYVDPKSSYADHLYCDPSEIRSMYSHQCPKKRRK